MTSYPCPCCGFLTHDEPTPGTFEICPVCWWQDCPVQAANVDYTGGPNGISLARARENFRTFGASEPSSLDSVRPPLPHERPAG